VSCAAASATLDVIEAENLVAHADQVGHATLAQLRELDHPAIANVRGSGLFFGVELVTPEGEPATEFAATVVEQVVKNGVLINRIGRHMNTLKMRPPMPFTVDNGTMAVSAIQSALNAVTYDG
jgi:4-aminobutyrate aminotransferase-like enzyme